ncbi:hypothetical protein K2173_017115 [Erythroxylum novogranatense]|uniref:Uncharacterized protein n=1 Tax=Erythroxylum novogranatense TaxID=1862640 RepID=A0AAV8U909_9ROSI|nr:hypothetical protein K2173_017115 [Erythroxylum novogranatense]
MMTMGTNGYYANGGGSSSSSSNLSALAPPFSVDTSSLKPNVIRYSGSSYSVNTSSPNPNPSNFLDSHHPNFNPVVVRATNTSNSVNNSNPNPDPDRHPPNCFDSHHPNLNPVDNSSVTPIITRYADSSYSVTTSNPNPNPHPHPPNSLNSHQPNFFTSSTPYSYSSSIPYDVDPFSSAPTDAIAYAHNPTTHVDSNPYYLSYVSSTIGDYALPHQFGYDLLSTSQVTTSSGSIADDYNQSLPALKHKSNWGCFWEGFPDWKQNEAVLTDANFYPIDNNGNPGFHSSMGTGTFEETLRGIDMIGSHIHIEPATAHLDYDSILGDNFSVTPPSCPTFSTWESSAVVPEVYPQMPSTKSVNSRFYELLSSGSYEQYSAMSNTNSNGSGLLLQSPSAFVVTPPVQSIYPNAGTGNGQENKDIAVNNPSTLKKLHLSKSSEDNVLYGINPVFHLEQNEHPLAEFSSTNDEGITCNENAFRATLDHLFEEKPSSQLHNICLDSLNLAIDNEVIGSVKNSPESVDHYNPAVDSPCWKGALPSSLSPFEGPQAQPLQIMRKLDTAKVTFEKSSESTLDCDNPENYLIPSPKRPSVADALFKQVIDIHTESGNHLPNCTYCHGVPNFDDLAGSRKECTLLNKSIGSSDHQGLHTEAQDHEGEKCTLRENFALGNAFVDMVKPNDDDVSSHMASNIAEDTMSSSASAEDAPTRLIKSHDGDSTSEVYVQNLVKAMHNLSEVLLFQCSSNALNLKVEDILLLKDAINNLGSCISKTGQRMTSGQVPLINRRSISQFDEKGQLDCEHVSEKENDVTPVKEDKNARTVRVAAEKVHEDNMTETIKKILSENLPVEEEPQPQVLLYRNLWLEAEASLCSLNYMARFNRMKAEMAKCSSQETNDNNTVVMSLPRSNATAGHCTEYPVAADIKGCPVPNMLFSNLYTLRTNSHVDDVMARHQLLKSRVDKCLSEGFLSSDVTAYLNKAESSVQEVNISEKPIISVQEMAMSSKSMLKDDVEASVMARFHALRLRDDYSESINREEYQPVLSRNSPASKGELEGKKLDQNVKSVVQNLSGKSSAEVSKMSEFHVFFNDDSGTQLISRSVDQPLASWYDSSSSDWEHVSEGELGDH